MAGSISLSLSQQFDATGAPLNGGLLYFYAAGTTTPQSAYQDYSLTIAWSNPLVLDSAGRIPAFYLADGQIKIRLTDSAGVVQVAADNLLVVGASAGTGTPPTVDATTIFSAGDTKWRYGTGTHTGWVRLNGRTIGNAVSGGTERANADTSALFTHLWTQDTTDLLLTVSTGRGASAAADYAAGKTIALPDVRGRSFFGPDSMGSTAAGRLGSGVGTFLLNNDKVGAGAGAEIHTLSLAQLPTGITVAGSTTVGTNLLNLTVVTGTLGTQPSPSTGGNTVPTSTASWTSTKDNFTGSVGATSNNTSGSAHETLPPAILFTPYMKL